MPPLSAWEELKSMEAGQSYELHHNISQRRTTPAFHSHDFYEIYFFIAGDASVYVEDYSYHMKPGDVVIMPPGYMHRAYFHNTEAYYERMYIYITRKALTEMGSADFSLINILDACIVNNKFCVNLEGKVFSSFCQIITEIISGSIGGLAHNLLMAQNKLSLLLIQLCVLLNETKDQTFTRSTKRVANVIAYINEHIEDRLLLDDISQCFFVSKYHLLREFKSYTHNTIYQYILAKRIIKSKLLLQEGLPPTSAYSQCGFKDYSSFYRAFRKETGMSPRQYYADMRG